jgi:hypothetical protein
VIATNEAVDVLRHGWQDAASTLAADVPEVAELLQARLEMAIATERLDERHLLDTIQEVESVTSRAGSASGQALARRLRRTVYEYLLALDAARPLETVKAPVDQPSWVPGSPMVGAEEVAALGHAATTPAGDDHTSPPSAADPPAEVEPGGDSVADDLVSPDTPAARRRFGLRRRQRLGADVADADDEAPVDHLDDAADGTPPVRFSPPPEPVLFDTGDGDGGPPVVVDTAGDTAAPPPPGDVPDAQAVPGPGFVAPRAGFHIVEDAPPHRAPDHDEPPLEMPAFAADEVAAGPPEEEPVDAVDPAPAEAGSDFLTWHAPNSPAPGPLAEAGPAPEAPESPPAAAGPAPQQPPLVPVAPAPTAAMQVEEDALDDDAESRGWGVRRSGEVRSPRRGSPPIVAPAVEDDPFENNTKLSDLRRRIEDRLRRKRCDEAAALLQEMAQETGGRAVAELAMNAGDRCRALGKSNAALNCYLAAARSDPVYELPLSRLADICIDNQDTELAVTYLERIARIYRFREDDRSALRTYRRIATIAPYREDILALLMNAERTGQLA